MNCAECKDLLVAHLEGLLDGLQEQAVMSHLESCEACRTEWKGLQTLQQRLVGNGKALAVETQNLASPFEDEVMNRIIREQNVTLKRVAQAGASLRLRRFLMKSPIARIAAAAAVVVACVLAVSMWKSTGSIALAAVVAKVEQVQAYLYRETATITDQARGDSTSETTVLMSNDYGMRTDSTRVNASDGRENRSLTYVLPHQKSVVMLNMNEKQYTRMALDDATVTAMKVQNRDPREMLKRLLACKYSELGTTVIDGVKVQGFETTDPAYLGETDTNVSARVWVAVDTWLPVRYELELDLREGVHLSAVQDGYEWDIRVDGSDFQPDIPADFAANELDGMQMPSYSEQGMIDALRMVAEFTGRYPAAIDIDALGRLTQDILTADTPAAQQLREQLKSAGSPEAGARMSQQRLMKLMVLSTFPKVLARQQAEPVYHGDVVTPNDAALPLMRWKTADNEYRVIFGDLHAETVGADTLATLESTLPK
jgi:hypothetical protein